MFFSIFQDIPCRGPGGGASTCKGQVESEGNEFLRAIHRSIAFMRPLEGPFSTMAGCPKTAH